MAKTERCLRLGGRGERVGVGEKEEGGERGTIGSLG